MRRRARSHSLKPRLRATAGLLLATSLFLSACTREDASVAEAQAAIHAVIEATEAANNAGDVEGWVALFAADAVYMPPGAPAITTREGLVETARAGFRHQAAIDIVPDEIQVCGDWAFARSRVTGTVRLHDTGEVVPIDIKQLVVYARQSDGAWRIARLIGNRNGA